MLTKVTNNDYARIRENIDPGVIFFTGPGCNACKSMYPAMETISQRMQGDVEFYLADVEVTGEIAQDLGIRSLPSLVLLVDGMVRDVTTGSKTTEDIRLWIQENI